MGSRAGGRRPRRQNVRLLFAFCSHKKIYFLRGPSGRAGRCAARGGSMSGLDRVSPYPTDRWNLFGRLRSTALPTESGRRVGLVRYRPVCGMRKSPKIRFRPVSSGFARVKKGRKFAIARIRSILPNEARCLRAATFARGDQTQSIFQLLARRFRAMVAKSANELTSVPSPCTPHGRILTPQPGLGFRSPKSAIDRSIPRKIAHPSRL
jgi:hypothetical protein